MRRLTLIAALCALSMWFHDTARAQDGAAIVTVTGKIAETNRGAVDPFADAFFAYHDVTFEQAYAFSRADLEDLGMEEITLRYPGWPRSVTLRGPALGAVLDHVGAQGAVVSVQALDGYAFRFEVETVRAAPFILAIEGDGRPLSIGGRGPAWLVFPQGLLPPSQGQADQGLVWAAFHISVE